MRAVRTFHFLTIHPSFVSAYFHFGVCKAARTKNLVNLNTLDLRKFAIDDRGTVDSRPYGGGDGMILRPEPLEKALATLHPSPRVINFSPGGKKWSQEDAAKLANDFFDLVFVCGRFGGIDQRFVDCYVDEEYSFGDFVVSGGELCSLMAADSILRLIPGTLGNTESRNFDSFSDQMNGFLEHPNYTRPQSFKGIEVPKPLVSGDPKEIQAWRRTESLKLTSKLRPDLLKE